MKRLTVKLRFSAEDEQEVGILAEQGRRTYFEFDPRFLETGLELSPVKMPARPGLIEHDDPGFGPLPGLFDDSLPDGWGLLLMDRRFRRQGLVPAEVSPLERLACLGRRTMGALTYHPHESFESVERMINLHVLGRNAEDVFEGDAAEVLPQLHLAGGSPAGARPKVLVGIHGDRMITGEDDLPPGFEHWLVKFSARRDAPHAGPVEYAYSLMARAAGIEMMPARLFTVKKGRSTRRWFGVRRFDRAEGNRRFHVHTFANLVHINFRIPSADYADLFKITRALTRNHQDVLRLFRLMAFNIAAGNRDDHAKNFAFLLDHASGEWALSPAYDLTRAPGPGGEHTMTVLGEGRAPGRQHCLALAGKAGLGEREAAAVIGEVNDAVARWPSFADEACCPRSVAASITGAIRRL